MPPYLPEVVTGLIGILNEFRGPTRDMTTKMVVPISPGMTNVQPFQDAYKLLRLSGGIRLKMTMTAEEENFLVIPKIEIKERKLTTECSITYCHTTS